MFKDRTTATISVVAAIAIVIMVVALITSPAPQAAVAPTSTTTPATTVPPTPNQTAVALATQAVGSDVQTTASGLKYRVVTEGTGPKPSATDTVTVNYRGVLLDGTQFDSSYDRGQPATFAVNGVIKGWTEGLQLMPVGSTYIFTIPPELGYGANANGPIPANATLVFQVELISIAGK